MLVRVNASSKQGVCDLPNYVGVGKHINITMKPTNSPTQGQPNPRKNRLKVAFGTLFPTANNFSCVRIDFCIGNRLRETQPNQIVGKHPIYTALKKYGPLSRWLKRPTNLDLRSSYQETSSDLRSTTFHQRTQVDRGYANILLREFLTTAVLGRLRRNRLGWVS